MYNIQYLGFRQWITLGCVADYEVAKRIVGELKERYPDAKHIQVSQVVAKHSYEQFVDEIGINIPSYN